MTDTNAVTQTMTLPPLGDGPEYVRQTIWLPQLIAQAMKRGKVVIEDRTFTECRLEGPAVLLAVTGCDFNGCDMGYSGGDIRNLLLRPVAPEKVIGAIAFQNCKFLRCTFFAVGFTGNVGFIESFQEVLGSAQSNAGIPA